MPDSHHQRIPTRSSSIPMPDSHHRAQPPPPRAAGPPDRMMPDHPDTKTISRFTPQNNATHSRLSTNTVGLVALSDFRKRRAELLEEQEREARKAATPDRSSAGTPDVAGPGETPRDGRGTSTPPKGKKHRAPDGENRDRDKRRRKTATAKKTTKKLLSFDDADQGDDGDADQGDDGDADHGNEDGGHEAPHMAGEDEQAKAADDDDDEADAGPPPSGTGQADPRRTTTTTSRAGLRANTAVGLLPRPVTKAALLREATEREALRREFLAVQEAVKATEIALPFIFHDGANMPGGTVRCKKGDFVWVFLDRSRKVGSQRRPGESYRARRAWARVGVDDLMLVRDTIIIPHHYDFYYFIVNRSCGPGGRPLFDFSVEATPRTEAATAGPDADPSSGAGQLTTAASRAAAAARNRVDVHALEGARDEATRTKVIDRRWYERNKHIYPASTWREFDPERDYASEVRKDTGGNTYFFAK